LDYDCPEAASNAIAYLSDSALASAARPPSPRVRRPTTDERIALIDRAAEIVTDFT
jgi:hypothetical protein